MVTKLGASVSKLYFIHNNNHIIIFYDPPNLLKKIHNSLKKLGLKVRESNVVSFYCSDSVLPIRMAPKNNTKTCGFASVFRVGEHRDNPGATHFHIAF